jgi:transposase-like protein
MATLQKILELSKQFKASGKTQKEFCKEIGIYPSTFSGWLKKLRNNPVKTTGGFVEVSVSTAPKQPLHELEICYPNGVRIKVPTSELALISKLVSLHQNV